VRRWRSLAGCIEQTGKGCRGQIVEAGGVVDGPGDAALEDDRNLEVVGVDLDDDVILVEADWTQGTLIGERLDGIGNSIIEDCARALLCRLSDEPALEGVLGLQVREVRQQTGRDGEVRACIQAVERLTFDRIERLSLSSFVDLGRAQDVRDGSSYVPVGWLRH
jgi:hypothetical protein